MEVDLGFCVFFFFPSYLMSCCRSLKKQLPPPLRLSDTEKRAQYIEEERQMREENMRLQRKLQREMERREALCRQLSESESSLEMDDERYNQTLTEFKKKKK